MSSIIRDVPRLVRAHDWTWGLRGRGEGMSEVLHDVPLVEGEYVAHCLVLHPRFQALGWHPPQRQGSGIRAY